MMWEQVFSNTNVVLPSVIVSFRESFTSPLPVANWIRKITRLTNAKNAKNYKEEVAERKVLEKHKKR
tara:strand:- start:182 stop:382 length:201 start_codon:yes stop_codon:yes gene_type:complete